MWMLLLACKPKADGAPTGDSGLDSEPCVEATLWADADSDGYGDPTTSAVVCEGADGWADARGDCDDTDPTVHPAADEVCNGADDDCDGLIDGADDSLSGGMSLYEDRDEDGYGDPDHPITGCAGDGVEDDTDCDDDDGTAHPGAVWYVDRDEDGYGDPDSAVTRCLPPAQHVSDGTDCDDASAEAHPGGAEVCDGVDNDCDDGTTEAGTARFVSSGGAAVTMTSALAGSSSNAKRAELTTDGTLSICEGTWYTQLDVDADLTVQGYDAVLDGADDGPIVTIAEGHDVALSGLTLTGATASQGAGIYCRESALTLDDVTITGNEASYGSALWAYGCDVDAADVEVSDNAANVYTAYVAGTGSSGRIDVTLDEVAFLDNHVTSYVHAYFIYADVQWLGASTTDSGMLRNTADSDSFGALYMGQATLDAQTVDFGQGADDNEAVDVYLSDGVAYNPGDDATFTCDADSCGSSSTYDLGGTSGSSSYSSYVIGALVEADTTATIDAIQFYGSSSSCDLDAYVYSSATGSGTWTLEWSQLATSLGSSTGWTSTDPIGLPVEDGRMYIVAVGFDCAVTTWLATSGLATDAGFGTVTGYAYKSSQSTPLTGDTTFTTSTSYTMPWRIRVDVTEL